MKRWVAVTVSVILAIVIVGGITLMAMLRSPASYRFLTMAKAQRSQEYLQSKSGYAREGVYVSSSSVNELSVEAAKDLEAPVWKRSSNKDGSQVKFDSETTHISIHARQSGGATIWIQEFRSANVSDRVRLWWKRQFR